MTFLCNTFRRKTFQSFSLQSNEYFPLSDREREGDSSLLFFLLHAKIYTWTLIPIIAKFLCLVYQSHENMCRACSSILSNFNRFNRQFSVNKFRFRFYLFSGHSHFLLIYRFTVPSFPPSTPVQCRQIKDYYYGRTMNGRVSATAMQQRLTFFHHFTTFFANGTDVCESL